ncbi:hypothetical protein RJ640_013215 [Escallonia rubra]|uniref:Late embryogenesis abundant protein LEA-2 subgroup domain-containing protein n=1 Tax=Escallonia rubra TaxID=112253 RepID=A0AA88UEW5_9ASTE|nr:hypothetical protein RJ640_013215 [Escallonia rubra]
MYEPHRSKTGRTTNLASCIVATVFLLFLAAGIVVVYFLLFKPKDPKIAVDAVQFPTFSVANGTVDFTFLQYVTVSNPNRDTFTRYDNSLQLAYSDAPQSSAAGEMTPWKQPDRSIGDKRIRFISNARSAQRNKEKQN